MPATAPTARLWARGRIRAVPDSSPTAVAGRHRRRSIRPIGPSESCTPHGGQAGRDRSLAVIRRSIAPQDGNCRSAAFCRARTGFDCSASRQRVRGRIVSSRKGQTRLVAGSRHRRADRSRQLEVQRGDTIDFVVDGRGRERSAVLDLCAAPGPWRSRRWQDPSCSGTRSRISRGGFGRASLWSGDRYAVQRFAWRPTN